MFDTDPKQITVEDAIKVFSSREEFMIRWALILRAMAGDDADICIDPNHILFANEMSAGHSSHNVLLSMSALYAMFNLTFWNKDNTGISTVITLGIINGGLAHILKENRGNSVAYASLAENMHIATNGAINDLQMAKAEINQTDGMPKIIH